MRGVPTALIDTSTLFREGLSKLIAKGSFNVTITSSSVEEVISGAPSEFDPKLIIIGTKDDDAWLENNIRALRARFGDARIVVLADQYSSDQVHTAFRMSARGYLMKTINCSALIKSLELVMLGESIFPSAILDHVESEHSADIEIDDEIQAGAPQILHAPRTLSARETQILQCLVRGQSNKMIARDLAIVEATVKVHIKAILRKIHVQNRTQAAIWAVNRMETPAAAMAGAHGSAYGLDTPQMSP